MKDILKLLNSALKNCINLRRCVWIAKRCLNDTIILTMQKLPLLHTLEIPYTGFHPPLFLGFSNLRAISLRRTYSHDGFTRTVLDVLPEWTQANGDAIESFSPAGSVVLLPFESVMWIIAHFLI